MTRLERFCAALAVGMYGAQDRHLDRKQAIEAARAVAERMVREFVGRYEAATLDHIGGVASAAWFLDAADS